MSIAQHVNNVRPGLPTQPQIVSTSSSPRNSDEEARPLAKKEALDDDHLIKDRSPLADLLYLRWLDGLKLKWPMQ